MTDKRCTCGEQTLCQCPVHRPADVPVIRDIAGQPLAIGDRVATLTPYYRYKLSLGTVVKFTPKGLKVQLDNPRWDGDGLVQLDTCQVCKVPGL